ncbi:MAG: Rab family GTPase [Candidatus Hodarchaeota archaeon]
MTEVTLKLILIGDAGTGKTTLAHRYMTGLFKDNKLTLGVQFHVKKVNITLDDDPDKVYSVKLQIWDFAGEKRFRFFLPSYCRGAHGGVFLYDITSKESLDHMGEWTELVYENAGRIPIMLVGAKSDLEEYREVSKDEGISVAKENELVGFVETSSKTGENVEVTFETIAKLMFEAVRKKA